MIKYWSKNDPFYRWLGKTWWLLGLGPVTLAKCYSFLSFPLSLHQQNHLLRLIQDFVTSHFVFAELS